MLNETLNKIFDIEAGMKSEKMEIEPQYQNQRIELRKSVDAIKNSDDEDVQLAKDNLRGMVEATSHALEELLNIAVQSQSSKHFDSVANLVKALNESNKFLFEMSTIKKEENIQTTNIQNNTAVFVGSTTDFLRTLKETI